VSGAVGLGLRLAVAGGPARAALVVLGNAVGVALLLVAVAVPGAVMGDGAARSPDERRLEAVIVLFLAVPVLVLLMTVARLSAATRDRRLAALRLLGLPPGGTRVVGAVENGSLALVGVVLGLALFAGARPVVEQVVRAGPDWFAADLLPPLGRVLFACVAVPVLSVVVSLAPTRSLSTDARAVRRQGARRRPSVLRLFPVAAGVGLLGWALAQPSTAEAERLEVFWVFAGGALLVGVFLPLAVPYLVRLVADLLVRFGRGQAGVLAARRLQVEPAASTRVVAGIVAALFVAAGAQSVVTVFERTPQFLAAQAAERGPQRLELRTEQPLTTERLAQLRQEPGVHSLTPFAALEIDCPADRRRPEGDIYCGNALLGTCVQLRQAIPGVRHCRDDTVAYLSWDSGPSLEDVPAAGVVRLRREESGGRRGPVVLRVPAPDLRWPVDANDTATAYFTMFVPASTPGAERVVREPHHLIAVLDGGQEAADRFLATVGEPSFSHPDYETLDTVRGYRVVLWTISGAGLAVGFLALLIAGVDRAIERRREVASLHVVGVPVSVVRRSQLIQAVLPLVIGVPLAGGMGLLAGAAYLNYGGERAAAPWPSVTVAVVAGLVAAVLVAAATVTALGRGVTPELLRRE